MHPPHVTQDPVPVVATVCRLVSEAWLIALYPCIGVGSGEVPVELPQFLYECVCAQVTIPLGV
ncbi:hypothetical protein V6B23_002819 [Enterobacter hormaechei]|nr:hypothetical protein [Enterobacter hormaechei]MBE3301971.1 hypothetical protein [Enterobacter cloacae complex sp. P30U]HCJ6263160.1 hypothetical protein [Enterobacter hormaechei subsp. xiangfangensis]HCM9747901.1 hypothetical protein [Enterobacter hormaechei subsp. steigerwaltii]EHF4994393.1 hypothetical protein [Enterobacter hormaechei]